MCITFLQYNIFAGQFSFHQVLDSVFAITDAFVAVIVCHTISFGWIPVSWKKRYKAWKVRRVNRESPHNERLQRHEEQFLNDQKLLLSKRDPNNKENIQTQDNNVQLFANDMDIPADVSETLVVHLPNEESLRKSRKVDSEHENSKSERSAG